MRKLKFGRAGPRNRVGRVVALVLLGVVVTPGLGEALDERAQLQGTERIVHVLNRLGYGPAPGDIERVRAMGVDAYIEEQLHPERIADARTDEALAELRSLRMDLSELREVFQPVAAVARRTRASAREMREEIDAGRRDRVGLSLPGEPLDARSFRRLARRGRPGDYEIFEARFLRAVYSRKQLLEVMVDFWANHFSMDLADHYYAAHYEENVLRPLALGKFEDLLFATARHPAMLEYLDNYRSAARAELLEDRVAEMRAGSLEDRLELRRRLDFIRSAQGLNENYARELMELHTLGVDGGYTQQDVIEVARALTGWTVVGGRDGEGEFHFDPMIHEPGDKVVLGRTIESAGVEEGEQILRMLARHPSTARFISTKLARRFVADDPPEAVVDAAAETFLETGGDIREVVRTIFASQEFFSRRYERVKIKKPLELVASSLRALGAEIRQPDLALGELNDVMEALGEVIYGKEAPDGYPDYGAAWLNTNSLLQRLGFAFELAAGNLIGIEVDLEAAERLLSVMEMSRPSAEELAESVRLAATVPPSEVEDALGGQAMTEEAMMGEETGDMGMSGDSMTQEETSAMMATDPSSQESTSTYTPEQVLVATMLGSPRFQKR